MARVPVVAVAVLVASCGAPQKPFPESSFPRAKAFEVFGAGFDQIARKYLEDVAIGPLAQEGVRGLASLDPELVTATENGKLVMIRSDRRIAQIALPGPRDVDAWASLVAEAATTGTRYSGELREAGPEGVYEAVFDSMLARLDGFSRYTGRRGAERNRAKRSGFEGIGINFRMVPKGALVLDVTPDAPAAQAGLRKDDIVTAIDFQPIANEDVEEVKDRLRGPSRSVVEILVERDDSRGPQVFRIERQHIIDPTVFSEVDESVLVVTITGFNNGTVRAVRDAVTDARRKVPGDLSGLVIDLRGNAGGLLKQAVQVADLFLASGRIISTTGRHPDSAQIYVADGRDIAIGLPIVLIVDGKTASAAEIVAAALQDAGRAVVVGTTSYGKGSVQTVIRLPNDGEMTLTWSRFVTPAGYVLHRLGVHPTICTSGIAGDDPRPLLEKADTPEHEEAVLKAWHHIRADDSDGRAALRRACPSESRIGKMELRLATGLIANPSLYRRFLLPPERPRFAAASADDLAVSIPPDEPRGRPAAP